MGRIVGGVAVALLLAGLAGCCASPKRFYQNAYGFECPETDYYRPGPPPPVTTPPGYTTPAVIPPPKSVTEQRI